MTTNLSRGIVGVKTCAQQGALTSCSGRGLDAKTRKAQHDYRIGVKKEAIQIGSLSPSREPVVFQHLFEYLYIFALVCVYFPFFVLLRQQPRRTQPPSENCRLIRVAIDIMQLFASFAIHAFIVVVIVVIVGVLAVVRVGVGAVGDVIVTAD